MLICHFLCTVYIAHYCILFSIPHCHLWVQIWLSIFSFQKLPNWLCQIWIIPMFQNHMPNKMCAEKKYCIVNFIHSIHKACQILSAFTSQCQCLHLHSLCLCLPHTPDIPILFTAIPQHIIISLIHCSRYTALLNTLRAGLLNCLNARSQGLTFRHRASCI